MSDDESPELEMGLKHRERLIDELRKENFGLKMRVFYLAESLTAEQLSEYSEFRPPDLVHLEHHIEKLETADAEHIEKTASLTRKLEGCEMINQSLHCELQETHSHILATASKHSQHTERLMLEIAGSIPKLKVDLRSQIQQQTVPFIELQKSVRELGLQSSPKSTLKNKSPVTGQRLPNRMTVSKIAEFNYAPNSLPSRLQNTCSQTDLFLLKNYEEAGIDTQEITQMTNDDSSITLATLEQIAKYKKQIVEFKKVAALSSREILDLKNELDQKTLGKTPDSELQIADYKKQIDEFKRIAVLSSQEMLDMRADFESKTCGIKFGKDQPEKSVFHALGIFEDKGARIGNIDSQEFFGSVTDDAECKPLYELPVNKLLQLFNSAETNQKKRQDITNIMQQLGIQALPVPVLQLQWEDTKARYSHELRERNLLLLKISQLLDIKLSVAYTDDAENLGVTAKINDKKVKNFSELKSILISRLEQMYSLYQISYAIKTQMSVWSQTVRDLDNRIKKAVETLHHEKLSRQENSDFSQSRIGKLQNELRSAKDAIFSGSNKLQESDIKISELENANGQLNYDLKECMARLVSIPAAERKDKKSPRKNILRNNKDISYHLDTTTAWNSSANEHKIALLKLQDRFSLSRLDYARAVAETELVRNEKEKCIRVLDETVRSLNYLCEMGIDVKSTHKEAIGNGLNALKTNLARWRSNH